MKTHVQLVEDWKWILKKAWSMRFIAASCILSGAEVAFQFLAPTYPGGWFALAAAITSAAAAYARVVLQRKGRV